VEHRPDPCIVEATILQVRHPRCMGSPTVLGAQAYILWLCERCLRKIVSGKEAFWLIPLNPFIC
jgi:hypothetical protein